MRIVKLAMAGTLESSDCLVSVSPSDHTEVFLESAAQKRFGAHLDRLIKETLDELNVRDVRVEVQDRGALDYCIRARIVTAVRRGSAEC